MDETAPSIEERLQALEDRLAIYQTVCGYGYAMDGCNAEVVGSFYAQDGVYTIGDSGEFRGRNEIAAIAASDGHRAGVQSGSGHISTLPYIVIAGDRATATCHTMLVQKGEQDFLVARLSASRIELTKGPDRQWRIDRRENHLLDGSEAGPDLLARLSDQPDGPDALR